MTRQAAPTAEAGFNPAQLFASLAGARGIVLAISGGVDSTALMVLYAGWPERPPALVVTVDHGIRPEAAGEAQLVAENAASLGLPSRIMHAPPRPATGNLQDWARQARYGCLAVATRDAGFDTIVTAHHQDDQAETFLLRLARGSGIYGLAAISGMTERDGLRLVRPLLGLRRAELAAIGERSGLRTSDDPSNADPRYDRVRVRGLLPDLARHRLTTERLAETAGRLGRAAAALDHYAGALLSDHFTANTFGVVSGSAAALGEAPEEVALRVLARMLQAVGGAEYTPRLDRIEALHKAIGNAGGGTIKRTLHGAVVRLRDGLLIVEREWGRNGISSVPASSGEMLVWDRRFRICVPSQSEGYSVGPLGAGQSRLRAPGASPEELSTLPGLFRLGELVAVPEGVEPVGEAEPLAKLAAECMVGGRLGIASIAAAAPPD